MVLSARSRPAKRTAPRPEVTSHFRFVIKAERERREWTQRQLSQYLGVSQSAVARWELGSRLPGAVELERIGHLLNIVFVVS